MGVVHEDQSHADHEDLGYREEYWDTVHLDYPEGRADHDDHLDYQDVNYPYSQIWQHWDQGIATIEWDHYLDITFDMRHWDHGDYADTPHQDHTNWIDYADNSPVMPWDPAHQDHIIGRDHTDQWHQDAPYHADSQYTDAVHQDQPQEINHWDHSDYGRRSAPRQRAP